MALRLLRESADRYATQGGTAPSVDAVLTAWLWVLSTPLPARAAAPRLPLRYFDQDADWPPAERSCEAMRTRSKAAVAPTLSRLLEVLHGAADAWSEGDPETPETRAVLRELLGVLWSQGFGRRPPSKQYPLGV